MKRRRQSTVACLVPLLAAACRPDATRDICQTLIARRIQCLDLRVAARQDARFDAPEFLAGAYMERPRALRACRKWVRAHPEDVGRLRDCLQASDCVSLESCLAEVALAAHVRRILAGPEDSPALRRLCGHSYARRALERAGSASTKELLQQLSSRCRSSVLRAAEHLRRTVSMALNGRHGSLESVCGEPNPYPMDREYRRLRERVCRARRALRALERSLRLVRGHATPRDRRELVRACRRRNAILQRLANLPGTKAPLRVLERACTTWLPAWQVLDTLTTVRKPSRGTCRRLEARLRRAVQADALASLAQSALLVYCPKTPR